MRPAIPRAAVPSARPGTGESPSACNPQSRRGRRAEEGPSSPCEWLSPQPHPSCPGLCCCSMCLLPLRCFGSIFNCEYNQTLTEHRSSGRQTQLVPEEKSASPSQSPCFPLCSSSPGALCQPRPTPPTLHHSLQGSNQSPSSPWHLTWAPSSK